MCLRLRRGIMHGRRDVYIGGKLFVQILVGSLEHLIEGIGENNIALVRCRNDSGFEKLFSKLLFEFAMPVEQPTLDQAFEIIEALGFGDETVDRRNRSGIVEKPIAIILMRIAITKHTFHFARHLFGIEPKNAAAFAIDIREKTGYNQVELAL